MSGLEHVPVRPAWTCRARGAAWPCVDARQALRAEAATDRVAVTMHLTAYWTSATGELNAQADVTYERFVAWLHRPDPETKPGS